MPILPKARSNRLGTTPVPLEAADGATGDHFGRSVAIDGDIAVVGAPNKRLGVIPFATPNAGKVYIFQRNGANWWQIAALETHKAENDYFGTSVAIEGEILRWPALIRK